jgi:pyruvate,orthophosphate dikinase
MTKWIYFFSKDYTEGSGAMSDLLGGKGANLAEMCKLGFPVPPGFTISTDLCLYYYENHESLPEDFFLELDEYLASLEKITSKKFGGDVPLLISVRSGAKNSMPGMMDTILNLGLNDETVFALAKVTGNKRFALDSYRRFIQIYSDVVLGLPYYHFENILDDYKIDLDIINDLDLTEKHLQDLCAKYKDKVLSFTGSQFPSDVKTQLISSIKAVLESWMSSRAVKYRQINNIIDSRGTAVNIQSMVFGNMGSNSATGVAFTRNPSTGEKILFGEFLVNAQGEDVVAGIRTPSHMNSSGKSDSMQELMPEIYNQFNKIAADLETHYKDMQDIEFTIENAKLYILQTRSGKRTAEASVKIAVDLVNEGFLTKEQALMRINAESLSQLLHARIDGRHSLKVIAKGLPASPGAATGAIVFSAEEAENLSEVKNVILVRNDTSPEDIKGMYVSKGVLTARGGMTSHAAVVARGMGTPCICGANMVKIDEAARQMKIGDLVIKAGDIISLDGSTGEVILGEAPLISPEFSEEFKCIMQWADEFKKLGVRANAETILDATTAVNFGAEGIGLCRTEHMFFDAGQIDIVRKMILANDDLTRRDAIAKLLPIQTESFANLFRIMRNLPVNIRLLDPPLHEFLPHSDIEAKHMSEYMRMPLYLIKERMEQLEEANPMLGHRGCRLGITFPEIYEMQVRAIFAAAFLVQEELGIEIDLEIMVPLIATEREFEVLRKQIENVYEDVSNGAKLKFQIGTMIELPRAALRAKHIALSGAEFFSFGTNDLTQTTYGISRDDISSFLPAYQEAKIFEKDPFIELDQDGVGQLIRIASEGGRSVNSTMKMGICGEHGANPKSINFCYSIGLDYVSCSPYRIPIAKLAAAQAAICATSAILKNY